MVIGAKPWLADVNNPLYEAGRAAVRRGDLTLSAVNTHDIHRVWK